MAELIKDGYDHAYITFVATTVTHYYPSFQQDTFIDAVFDEAWINKELKARTDHIAAQLDAYLLLPLVQKIELISQLAKHFVSYRGMFIPAYVELYGLNEFDASITALSRITEFASAEFAVRPFIEKYPEKMQKTLLNWASDDNEHLRRLASEGCRPRLPWAMSLPAFKKDPNYILPILECLKCDDSEYVRRSVANNLNDIAKDHPQQVLCIAQRWLKESDSVYTQRLVKHACRTLLKQANPDALILFGFLNPQYVQVSNFTVNEKVQLGDAIDFSFQLNHVLKKPLGKLRIEFAIDFMKKKGTQARKVFQLSESTIKTNEKIVNKSFSFRKISTRQYYVGHHRLAILVNGQELAKQDFMLES